MKKELSIEEQISILEKTKEHINNNNHSIFGYYICHALCLELYNRKLVEKEWEYPFNQETYIPLFTHENARIACKKAKVKLPYESSLAFWEPFNKKSRITFINWMINELKTQMSTK